MSNKDRAYRKYLRIEKINGMASISAAALIKYVNEDDDFNIEDAHEIVKAMTDRIVSIIAEREKN